jgi:intracellular sulfur oxidation DsrE/DsrF family protein
MFKLVKAIDLMGMAVNMFTVDGFTNTFNIRSASGSEGDEIFRCPKNEDLTSWFNDIERCISSLKVKKVDRRATTMIQVPAGLPTDRSLGPRCQHIHKFLASEIRLADTLNTMVLAVIQPMIEASKGAVLKVVNVTQNNFKTADGSTAVQVVANVNNKALFDDKDKSSKYQIQHQMEALQAADVQIFLHAAEALAAGLRDFVDTLRLQCSTGGEFYFDGNGEIIADNFSTLFNRLG